MKRIDNSLCLFSGPRAIQTKGGGLFPHRLNKESCYGARSRIRPGRRSSARSYPIKGGGLLGGVINNSSDYRSVRDPARSHAIHAIPRDPRDLRDPTRSRAIHAILRDPTRSYAIPRDPRSHAIRDHGSLHIPGGRMLPDTPL